MTDNAKETLGTLTQHAVTNLPKAHVLELEKTILQALTRAESPQVDEEWKFSELEDKASEMSGQQMFTAMRTSIQAKLRNQPPAPIEGLGDALSGTDTQLYYCCPADKKRIHKAATAYHKLTGGSDD